MRSRARAWLVAFVVIGLGCRRREVEVRSDPVAATTASAAPSPKKEKHSPPPEDSASAHEIPEEPPPDPASPPPEPKPKLEAFLSIIPPAIPSGAYALPAVSYGHTYAPKGFDPLHEKPDRTWRFPDGSDLLLFEQDDGASDSQSFLAVVLGGKLTHVYDAVRDYTIDPVGGRLALVHYRPDSAGKRVAAREIIDLSSGSISPLPKMPCTDSLAFVDSGTRLLGQGYDWNKGTPPYMPHAYLCLFDTVAKLMVEIDAGMHNGHAASIDFINMTSGVLPKEPAVVWATREYEPYGNYDLTLIDTRPPHARKMARLATPSGQLATPSNLEIDLADVTMASTEVKFRGKSGEGWWWKWQTATLVDAP